METTTTAKPDLAQYGITVESVFVPWSVSRSAKKRPGPGDYNLNWEVTVRKDGRHVLTTEYTAGQGHCPAYNAKISTYAHQCSPKEAKRQMIIAECEKGFACKWAPWHGPTAIKAKPILPGDDSVMYSLLMDSSVLDYGSFEDWASEYGFDPDSRKAEAAYRECLEIALKLRNALGEALLAHLREDFQAF